MKATEIILAELQSVLTNVTERQTEEMCNILLSARKILLCGYGRSGLAAKGFAMRLAQLGLLVQVVGETVTTAIGAGDLLIIVSSSGKTEGLCSKLTKAKTLGAKSAVLTGSGDSALSQNADLAIVLEGVDNKYTSGTYSNQPLGSLFEQSAMLFLDGVILTLMARTGKSSEDLYRLHANME